MRTLLLIVLSLSIYLFYYYHSKEGKSAMHKSAVYLTNGSEAHNIEFPWGGCHITMTGFHKKHSEAIFLEKIPKILAQNAQIIKEWRPEKVSVVKKKYWRVIFESETLNIITKDLKRQAFEKIKGPEFAKVPFHMDLPHIQTQKDAEAYADALKDKPWFVTIVMEDPVKKEYRWLKYFPLN